MSHHAPGFLGHTKTFLAFLDRWRVHPDRVNFVKSLSGSELSRRRIKVNVSPKKPSEPAPRTPKHEEPGADGFGDSV